ncbi:hypothetical protein SAXI111661_20030 [Saccharomonospora xinjiangensis]
MVTARLPLKLRVFHTGHPEEHSDPRTRKVRGPDRGVLQRRPHRLQHETLLGVHQLRLAGGDAEERRVECLDVVEVAAPAGDLADPLAVLAAERPPVPARGRGLGDEVVTGHEMPPERVQIRRAGQPSRHADHGRAPRRRGAAARCLRGSVVVHIRLRGLWGLWELGSWLSHDAGVCGGEMSGHGQRGGVCEERRRRDLHTPSLADAHAQLGQPHRVEAERAEPVTGSDLVRRDIEQVGDHGGEFASQCLDRRGIRHRPGTGDSAVDCAVPGVRGGVRSNGRCSVRDSVRCSAPGSVRCSVRDSAPGSVRCSAPGNGTGNGTGNGRLTGDVAAGAQGRQRGTVDLVVGRLRQRGQLDQLVGDQVLRKPQPEVLTPGPGTLRRGGVEAAQHRRTRPCGTAQRHGGVGDTGQFPRGLLDLGGLHPVTPDLELRVDAPEILQLPARRAAHEITRAVQAG